jgi:septal ring factor EnvC (AmiA/AmiB activator)
VTPTRFVAVLLAGLSAAQTVCAAPAEQPVPARQAGNLPNSEQRYRELKQQVERATPTVTTARQKSEALAAQAANVRQQLIATAARVQSLEREKAQIDFEVTRLAQQETALSRTFARDRVRVSHLLAVLERLQSDLPPAVALEPADALRSARGAMLLGAALPQVYGAAASLARQLRMLKQTRAALLERRKEGVRNAAKLTVARGKLDQLLAMKARQASGATAAYEVLQAKLDRIASQAADLKTLLDRVAALRTGTAAQGVVVVASQDRRMSGTLKPGALAQPVVGPIAAGTPEDADKAPGLSFVTAAGASVVAPADSEVLFAGRYHKTGEVLILEMPGGYDLVLAGMDRIDVRPGDQLLAGEPVGRMPRGNGARLYFELRRNGKGVNPAPWLGIDLRKAKKS